MLKNTLITLTGIFLMILSVLTYNPLPVMAAVGCTLTNPDRDIRNIFPESTGYKTYFKTIRENGGDSTAVEIEKKLEDKLEEQYENNDIDHVYYQVFNGKKVIGYVFGINQTGEYGLLQLILATDTNGKILLFYYQRFRSPNSEAFKNTNFTGKLAGHSLASFYAHSKYKGTSSDPMSNITDPTGSNDPDFQRSMRGLKLNLILFDIFWLSRKYDAYLK